MKKLSLLLAVTLWLGLSAPVVCAQDAATYGSDLTVGVSQELIDADRAARDGKNPPSGQKGQNPPTGMAGMVWGAAGALALGTGAVALHMSSKNRKRGRN
ncbi:hypothetical protein [Eubacterium sp. 1001713B170207_170306_E7]|uniref:hypothetical protein n=1 Tax=Eubacterium sp. 1001713B170207_170306_E7 TaxID=2787097 RepID=UPI001899C33C|nr:hypothetical protein [Eubacterium sp. 1001713B170207_170306_E7]